MESHLLQMRGLKLCYRFTLQRKEHVASFTDAWIETTTIFQPQSFNKSHLLQMRGLKQA